jgi:hypothetical protein
MKKQKRQKNLRSTAQYGDWLKENKINSEMVNLQVDLLIKKSYKKTDRRKAIRRKILKYNTSNMSLPKPTLSLMYDITLAILSV